MPQYTKDDILRLVEEEDIQFIRMQFTDIFGQLKNVAITASQISRALNNHIMMDGSSIDGYVRVEESDQYLYPDLNSFTILPWRPQYGKVARMICDVHNPDGTPFMGDPRNVLKRVLRRAEDMGFTFNAGPELEFFLFQTDDDGKPTAKTADQASYFDLGPLDHGEGTRREVSLSMEQMGIAVEASHHETSPGQHEIDLKYGNALRTADNIMTFKLAVKTLAQKNGLHATFMPKPIAGQAGSGMHMNMSLFRGRENIFYDAEAPGQLSETALQFIAGILAHARNFCAITNPLVNSYKRLVPGFEAPCHLSWSSSNRSALIRIPAPRGEGTRVELRNPDPSCNPYLALAACLAAGLDGIEKKMTPPPAITQNIFALSPAERSELGLERLPHNLKEALDLLQSDSLLCETLGEPVVKAYVEGKLREWDAYNAQVSQWELDHYLVSF